MPRNKRAQGRDRLRDLLEKNGIAVKDSKEGQSWDWQL
jgi:cysteinyl-tRNA synthetase